MTQNKDIITNYIDSVKKQFLYYKSLAEKSIITLSDDEFFSTSYSINVSEEINSVAIIVKHLAGNMKSRWTDAFTTDGEKEWRERDLEFKSENESRENLMEYWEESWGILFDFIDSLDENNFNELLYIRNMGHTVMEAINRQLCHYSYHVGQIVLIGKSFKGNEWESLSIPKQASKAYNKDKFSKEKSKKHFTEDL
jgi:hypothetical protein